MVEYCYPFVPDSDAFFELFETTGWNRDYGLSPQELYGAVKNSWFSVSAYDENRLVGFGRMISDGVMHALVLDMIIHPDYQGQGIGREVLNILKRYAEDHHIRDFQLFCAKGKVPFYERSGFCRRPEDAPGMEMKRTFFIDGNAK